MYVATPGSCHRAIPLQEGSRALDPGERGCVLLISGLLHGLQERHRLHADGCGVADLLDRVDREVEEPAERPTSLAMVAGSSVSTTANPPRPSTRPRNSLKLLPSEGAHLLKTASPGGSHDTFGLART
jgi:hypothetical protein